MPEAPHAPVFPGIPAPGEGRTPTDRVMEVWWTPVDVSAATLAALRPHLDPATTARVNAMVREIDRRRTILAHGLLRRLVAACTGADPAAIVLTRRCETCGSTEHGKPALAPRFGSGTPPLHFNLAHSGEVVAVVLAGPNTPVGIDVEAIRPEFDWEPSRRHVFTEDEWLRTEHAPDPSAERFALWARKEAAAKATGHGLSIDLAQIAISPEPGGDGAYRARLVATDREHALLIRDVALTPGTAAAVAVLGPGPVPVPVVRRAAG